MYDVLTWEPANKARYLSDGGLLKHTLNRMVNIAENVYVQAQS